jgi:hypothetical protein
VPHLWMTPSPSATSLPRLAVGGGKPKPVNPKPASAKMAMGMPKVTGPRLLGSMC